MQLLINIIRKNNWVITTKKGWVQIIIILWQCRMGNSRLCQGRRDKTTPDTEIEEEVWLSKNQWDLQRSASLSTGLHIHLLGPHLLKPIRKDDWEDSVICQNPNGLSNGHLEDSKKDSATHHHSWNPNPHIDN